jgi:kynurenine formamidase
VLHVQHKVRVDPRYAVSLQDGLDYEAAHGRIPPNAIVAAATGWGVDRYHREKTEGAYFNANVFPGGFGLFALDADVSWCAGFSLELVKWLVEQRQIAGIAIDTLSGDIGTRFSVHAARGSDRSTPHTHRRHGRLPCPPIFAGRALQVHRRKLPVSRPGCATPGWW